MAHHHLALLLEEERIFEEELLEAAFAIAFDLDEEEELDRWREEGERRQQPTRVEDYFD